MFKTDFIFCSYENIRQQYRKWIMFGIIQKYLFNIQKNGLRGLRFIYIFLLF